MPSHQPPRLVFERWTSPIDDRLKAGGIELYRLHLDGPAIANWRVLESADFYHVPSRVDCAGVDGGSQWLVDAHLTARCPNLLAVSTAGAGMDTVDIEACTAAGILACNNSGPGAEAVAEHVLGLMLSLAKNIARSDRALRREARVDRMDYRGTELAGKTLGIVGYGRVGSRVAALSAAFPMRVLAFDPGLDPAVIRSSGAEPVTFRSLLERADYVLASCPLTAETTNLFDANAFATMKEGSYFISTARGQVHDEGALYDALVSGRLGGAGLDVFHVEPPPPDHPLLSLDTVIATPHVAGITREGEVHIAESTLVQWLEISRGAVPKGLANPAAWPLYQERFERRFGFAPEPLMYHS